MRTKFTLVFRKVTLMINMLHQLKSKVTRNTQWTIVNTCFVTGTRLIPVHGASLINYSGTSLVRGSTFAESELRGSKKYSKIKNIKKY